MSNGKLSRNDALESQFVDGRIILQWIVWNWDVKIRTVWSWFGLEKQKIPFQTHSWLIDSCWKKDWLLKCDLKELPLNDSKAGHASFNWHVQINFNHVMFYTPTYNSLVFISIHYSLTNARCCTYSCMCSWWWVKIPLETCRTVYRYK